MSQRHIDSLQCMRCGKRHGERATICQACKTDGRLRIIYDYQEAGRSLERGALERREPWMWRYKELLPIDDLAELPPLQVGMTPVWGAPRLAGWVGLNGLWLKDEGRNPTGSYTDRASALTVAQAGGMGSGIVAIASNQSAGPSLACLAASVGLKSVVFAGTDTPKEYVAHAQLYGALVLNLAASIEESRALCNQASQRFGWFNGDLLASPLGLDGLKTAGLEIAEQLGERMPDWIVVGDEDEDHLLADAVAQGMEEMRALGLIRQIPNLLRVTCTPAAQAKKVSGNGESAWSTVWISVDENSVAPAIAEVAAAAGVAVDQITARAVAGLKKAVEQAVVAPTAIALLLINARPITVTGGKPIKIAANLEQVERQAKSHRLL